MKTLERLFAAGFRPIAIPPYESALCVGAARKRIPALAAGASSAAHSPRRTYIVDGNLSVKLKRGSGEVFVWKKKELEATPERLKELESFRQELASILDEAPTQ